MVKSQGTESKDSVKQEASAPPRKTIKKPAPEIVNLSDDDVILGMYLFLYIYKDMNILCQVKRKLP